VEAVAFIFIWNTTNFVQNNFFIQQELQQVAYKHCCTFQNWDLEMLEDVGLA